MRTLLIGWILAILFVVFGIPQLIAKPLDQVKLKVYHAEWCGWCKRYKPETDKLSLEGVCIERIDVTDAKDPAIKALPYTEILDKEGNLLKKFYGFMPVSELKKMIEEL